MYVYFVKNVQNWTSYLKHNFFNILRFFLKLYNQNSQRTSMYKFQRIKYKARREFRWFHINQNKLLSKVKILLNCFSSLLTYFFNKYGYKFQFPMIFDTFFLFRKLFKIVKSQNIKITGSGKSRRLKNPHLWFEHLTWKHDCYLKTPAYIIL